MYKLTGYNPFMNTVYQSALSDDINKILKLRDYLEKEFPNIIFSITLRSEI